MKVKKIWVRHLHLLYQINNFSFTFMKTILLIEDDTALRENTAELLELSGYTVVTAPNGKIGIQKALSIIPDVIVCDIMMPEMDGYGVLQEMTNNSKTRHIPFIFLSAKTEHKEIRKGMDLGADDYITKPFEEEELISAIESRIARAKILFDLKNEKNSEDDESIRNLHQLKNFFWDEGEVSNYKRGMTVYNRGEHSNIIYLILKGVVKTHTMDVNGKELITGLYKPDDFLGFTSFDENIPYSETATAVEDAELVGISKKQVADILRKSQEVSMELMNLLTDNLSNVKEQLIQMAYSSVRKKTASTILQFVNVINPKPGNPIRILRSDLAATAGIATESLIRTLSDFKKDGLIEIEGRDIRVLDRQGLEMME